MNTENQNLTISELSTMLGISGPTLRFWEHKFAGVLEPLRTAGGQRRYNAEHVEILNKIIDLKKKGLRLSEIRTELLKDRPDSPLQELDENINQLAERIAISVQKEIQQFLKDYVKPTR
jgi:DNA-binding transcriptional MerR regulator